MVAIFVSESMLGPEINSRRGLATATSRVGKVGLWDKEGGGGVGSNRNGLHKTASDSVYNFYNLQVIR
jgi:hypothetical protein